MISATATPITWHGTQQDSFDLVNAVARNCQCEFGAAGVRLSICEPHRMLTEDQRALNGLLFGRSIADRLRSEEFAPIAERVPTRGRRSAPPGSKDPS